MQQARVTLQFKQLNTKIDLRYKITLMYINSRLYEVIKQLSKKEIKKIIETKNGDKYTKKFSTWDHLVTMIIVQLSGGSSLRDIEFLIKNMNYCIKQNWLTS